MIAHGVGVARPVDDRRARRPPRRSRRRGARPRRRPTRRATRGVGCFDGDRDDVPVDLASQPRRDAEQLAGHVRAVGLDHDHDRCPRLTPLQVSIGAASALAHRRAVQRAAFVEHVATASRTCSSSGASARSVRARGVDRHDLHRADRGGRGVGAPRPGPRSAAVRRRMRSAGTAARPAGRPWPVRTAARRTTAPRAARPRPASSRRRARSARRRACRRSRGGARR